MNVLTKLISKLKSHLPLVGVVVVGLIAVLTNIDPQTYYSGWDNILVEFNIWLYVKRVLFGAWQEHQGLGAPMSLSHLAEIPRLPILLALKAALPDNLVRYVYLLGMYLLGGVGSYFYLLKTWFKQQPAKKWLAALGAVFYLFHLLTIQQFYIVFELFAIQFGLLPFLLLTIERLNEKADKKAWLWFILVQLLLAPSGHTATLFYLGTAFSLAYAFGIKLKNGWLKALKFGLLIGAVTLFIQSYWIAPNLYYTFNNAHYVAESHDNQLFGPESLASIKEAGSWSNFLTGRHYLFEWKDYSFTDQKFEFIFAEWREHLAQPVVNVLAHLIGVITFLGLPVMIFSRKYGHKRWAILGTYFFSLSLIWIELMPTRALVDWLYESPIFLEIFRNPFTKLSIIYSFVSMLLFTTAIQGVINQLRKKWLGVTVILMSAVMILIVATPAFSEQLISEKLKVKYPEEYFSLFSYLKQQDPSQRMLILPQRSHAGWVYHDWQFIEPDNGYQGMGFMPFAVPQAVLNRDSDRWVETSDSFYHQLKHALDIQDLELIGQVLTQYRVDLILIDETKLDIHSDHDYQLDHRVAASTGYKPIWSKGFLTLYQRQANNSKIFAPTKIASVSNSSLRTNIDVAYQTLGDYTVDAQADFSFPFDHLMARETTDFTVEDNSISVTSDIDGQKYLSLPAYRSETYVTPMEISYESGLIQINFPTNIISLDEKELELPQLPPVSFKVEYEEELIIFFNQQGYKIRPNEQIYPVLATATNQPIDISYAPAQNIDINDLSEVTNQQLHTYPAITVYPNWTELLSGQEIEVGDADKLKFTTHFPTHLLNLEKFPSSNCSQPERGEIETYQTEQIAHYWARDYAVNCASYQFEYLSPAYSYVTEVVGQQASGRSLKLFVNYSENEILPIDYLFPESNYQLQLLLPQVTNDPQQRFVFNWETRSFGGESHNQIESIKIGQFPLERVAQIRLSNLTHKTDNQLQVKRVENYFNWLYLVKTECQDDSCYLALDESYDDLWLALDLTSGGFLPHAKLNNWVNLWQVNNETEIAILYLPELIQLLLWTVVLPTAFTTFLLKK